MKSQMQEQYEISSVIGSAKEENILCPDCCQILDSNICCNNSCSFLKYLLPYIIQNPNLAGVAQTSHVCESVTLW
jgi:hypothetical protein